MTPFPFYKNMLNFSGWSCPYKNGALLAKFRPGVLNPFVFICGCLLYHEIRANARNVSFRISLRWLIHTVINPVDKTQLFRYTFHRRSTTVSLETYPSIVCCIVCQQDPCLYRLPPSQRSKASVQTIQKGRCFTGKGNRRRMHALIMIKTKVTLPYQIFYPCILFAQAFSGLDLDW